MKDKNALGIKQLIRAKPLRGSTPSLHYVVPNVNWVLDWVGHYITTEVKSQFGLETHLVQSAKGLRRKIVHYGSLWDLAPSLDTAQARDNSVVGTIFHGDKNDPQFHDALTNVLTKQDLVNKFHTASRIMETRLLNWGIPAKKVVRIPLGVDLQLFHPNSITEKKVLRRKLGIPEDTFCIGSFHKDGNGWEEGFEPKLIKGPDVFLEVISQLSRRYPLFVLLSAPARGYVKRGLDKLSVPYQHIVEEDYQRIPRHYHAIDLYLLTSREEGGPKGVLESLASGVPFVGTKVGLVPDVVTSGKDGLLANSEDVTALAEHVSSLIEQPQLRTNFSKFGLNTIKAYGWPLIAGRYYHELYQPLLAM